ncbi:TPA: hypothetical protein N3477_001579 [Klebsiella pneumoniae]|nr:hypothetical protein [Klebsiella pneumoniae]HCM5719781.1 hypothetical protein [Klebsiella pneumoniae]HCM5725316.1 hypothetical protein [Klebsiella pneumoniae]HCM7989916.1 hypothetical protein [Klebsiella pneumoniae]HCM8006168.1 hypothetical protein [Klebsiella pneumoniae]
MADLKQIQFRRTKTAGKKPTTSNISEGELALNMADSALYTRSGDAIIQLTGKNMPEIDTNKLTVAGTTTLKDNVTVAPNKSISFETTDLSGEITRHIVGKCATNDGWYIGAGGTSNSGILEIGTIDDGVETIQFVQRGAGNVEARKLVLLDSSGSTTLPGDLRLTTNKTVKISNGSTLTLEMGVGANDAYIKNLRGSGVLQLTNDSNLSFRNYQVYYAMNGRGPGKSGTLLTNVENNRQAWQYTISAATATTPRWVKVATMKHPGMASSQLDLMITGGVDSGHGKHYVDFITLSGRNLQSWSTNNLDNWVEWRRIGSPSKTNVPEYYVVKNGSASDTTFDFYAKIPRYGNGLYVTVLNTAGYNGQSSGNVIIYETGQDTGATGPTGSILVSMKQIFDSYSKPDFGDTTGTLPVNRGGTGATNAGDARNNLGLRTAAVRDVGESNGNVMEVGAYGLGGNGGKSINDIVSNADMLTRLKAYGGTFWRGVTKSGVSVQNGLYSHGSGIFMNAGDTMSAINIDYASAKVRVYAANNTALAAGNVNYNELYGTANKPTKADVGLGNLTNDTQVKKAGDTMTGDLTAPNFHATGPGTASVYVNAGTGNAHVWFRTDGNERGVIWATPNTADLGQINIRAKTTGGVSAGDFSFRSDGRLDIPVAVKIGGAAMLTKDGNITSGSMFGGNLNNYLTSIKNDIVAGDNKQVSKTGDTMTGNLTINANLKVENPNGTMVDLGSENSDKYSRLTLARKVGSGAAVAMLKVTPEGHVQFGYQTAVATPAPSKYILVKSSGLDVEGDLVFNQTYRGTEEAVDISDKTIDLNSLVIKKTDPGTRQLYKCVSSGGGNNISNKPTSDGNFVLEVLSLRKVSDTDWSCKQTFTTKNGGVEGTYIRYAQNGSWSAWKEVVAGVQPINLGGTGATSVAAARNNLGLGTGNNVNFASITTGAGTFNSTLTANGGITAKGTITFTSTLNSAAINASGVINANGGIIVPTTKYVQIADAPTQNNQATNKQYVDDKVASAISNAGDTYLPLAGGTVTGNLNVTGSQLKTTSLWVTGNSALNGALEVGGNVVSNTGIGSFVGAVDVKAPAADNGTTHLWFRHSNGGERGVIYMPRDNNTMMGLRAASSEWQLHGSTGQITGPGARWTLHSDGNLQGVVYGGYITDYINSRFNQCAQWVRTGARWDIGPIGRPSPGKTVDPGWVMIGLNADGNEANQNMRIIAGRLQVWKPGVQWVDSAT